MKRITITVTDETAAELERIASERCVSKAKVVEKAILDLAKTPVWSAPHTSRMTPAWPHTIRYSDPYGPNTTSPFTTTITMLNGGREEPPEPMAVPA